MITFVKNHIYSNRDNEWSYGGGNHHTNSYKTSKPRIKYDIGDLPYYTLDGFLAAYWDHEHFILNLMYTRNPFYAQQAPCEAIENTDWCSHCEDNAHFALILRAIVSNDQEEAENNNFKERNPLKLKHRFGEITQLH